MSYIDTILKETLESKSYSPFKREFRVSSFPYCPIVDLYKSDKKEDRENSYSFDFYTRIGTSIHSLIQGNIFKTSTHGHRVFGNWKCLKCKKFWSKCQYSVVYKDIKRNSCKDGNLCNIDYVELEFNLHGLSGHLDLLGLDENNKFHAFEFKTTGSGLFEKPFIFEKYYPNDKHMVQIQTYCSLLYLLYGIKVYKFHIIYINRDKVKKDWTSGNIDMKKSLKSYSYRWRTRKHNMVTKDLKLAIKGNKEVNKILENKGSISNLIKYKPCKTKDDYDSYMSAHFFKESCPFYKDGSCFKHSFKKKLKSLVPVK